jgi:hypothetical protein
LVVGQATRSWVWNYRASIQRSRHSWERKRCGSDSPRKLLQIRCAELTWLTVGQSGDWRRVSAQPAYLITTLCALGGSQIGRITTSGQITEFPLPTGDTETTQSYSMQAYGIAVGPDGALWYTEIEGNKVGWISIS